MTNDINDDDNNDDDHDDNDDDDDNKYNDADTHLDREDYLRDRQATGGDIQQHGRYGSI
jgi:hypothetical protein